MAPAGDLRRAIGFWGGVAIVVGSVIGSGIFRTPYEIAKVLHDPPVILGLWVLFGIVSLCGALTLAELATLLPKTGGTYVYLRAAYGDSSAFVFGWLYLLVAIPSGMAALSTVFSERLLEFFTPPATDPSMLLLRGVAIGTIVLLSLANIIGVRFGTAIQGVLTIVKVGALVSMIAVVVALGHGDWGHVTARAPASPGGVAEAAKNVIFTYNAWVYISLVAGEVTDVERRLKGIIITGMSVIIVLYLAANVAYFYMLPVEAMASEQIVARRVMRDILGNGGAGVMGACIMASVFGALNGVVLTKSRVAYALSRDGLGFPALGRCHPRFATPYVSILVQGAVAIALIFWLKDFKRLTTYFVVVEWTALIFAIAAVFVLRRKIPDAPRPYRTPLYPWVPLFFVVGTTLGLAAIVWSNARNRDFAPLIGLGIALSGFPVYWIWKRKYNAPQSGRAP
jgi:APA family basic amino acid/polyamine antiporter